MPPARTTGPPGSERGVKNPPVGRPADFFLEVPVREAVQASSRPMRTPMALAIIRPRVQPELSPRA